MVVLPIPEGPYTTREGSTGELMASRSSLPGLSISECPTYSPKDFGFERRAKSMSLENIFFGVPQVVICVSFIMLIYICIQAECLLRIPIGIAKLEICIPI